MGLPRNEIALADAVAEFYDDPLGFVLFAYRWGEPGPLQLEEGPDDNQREFLESLGREVKARGFDGRTPVMPIRMAETSGHGTGKSAMGAWLTDWILSTRPNSIGTVTAGTATQLADRTWAAIQWWTRLCITAHWFEIQAHGIFAHASPETWKVVAQTCKEENAQSFAGQHAATSTSWYLFDEASTVPDAIWRVAYGGLTDGEPMWWGEPGPLQLEEGPDDNQREFLESLGREVKARGFDGRTPVMPIRMAETSGHGTGKSAMGAWLTDWILSTRPNSIGTVTAGTATQLADRTWAAIQWWTRLCITAHWFEIQAHGIFAHASPETWKVVAQTCKEENAQSFAGQHAATSTSWYLFDEASTVPDAIWRVAYGGLTDGEPMFFAWGQPERNTGEFHEICFGRFRDRWNKRCVDSRTSRFTNKEYIDELARDYGEDSDYYRVRVLGQPPRASELQFVDRDRIYAAQKRLVVPLDDDPLIAGVDVSGGGAAWNVVRFRRGVNARSLPPIRIPGEHGRDREMMITKLAQVLTERSREKRVAMMFVDSAFGSPIVERLRVLGFENVVEVNFGGRSPNNHQENARAYMYSELKDWLLRGAIDPNDERLAEDLCAPGYHINRSGKLVLESKQELVKRLGRSPDDADALALTFARPVAPVLVEEPYRPAQRHHGPNAWQLG